jgi:hypothetical protein
MGKDKLKDYLILSHIPGQTVKSGSKGEVGEARGLLKAV